MQLMLKAHDTLFRVWELAVSFLGLPPLPLVPRENTNRRRTVQRRTIWIADAHRDDGKRFVVHADVSIIFAVLFRHSLGVRPRSYIVPTGRPVDSREKE